MQRILVWSLAACGAITACGCGSTANIVRGQSPAALQQASFGYNGPVHETMHEHYTGTDISHYTVDSGAMGGSCPSGYGCPPCGQGCPVGGCPGGACGHGHCGGCGNGQAACGGPHHGYSFAYEYPNDLSYPPSNVPGGAVVYPYYTHKGPSDFFRTK